MSAFFRCVLLGALWCIGAPICFAQTPAPAMLVEVADFTGLALSPDGQSVAFRVARASIDRNTHESAWYVAPANSAGAPVAIADGGEPLRLNGAALSESPIWSSDSRWLYFRALRQGEVQVWRASRNGRRVQWMTDDPANVIAFDSLESGDLVYEVGATRREIEAAEEKEYEHGIRIDHTVPIGRNLFRSGYIDGRLASERYTGNWMLTAGVLADAPSRYRVVKPGNRRVRDAAPDEIAAYKEQQAPPDASLAGRDDAANLQLDGDRVAYALPDDGTHLPLRARLAGRDDGERACLESGCAQVVWFQWRPGSDEVVFASRDADRAGAYTLRAWDVGTNAVREIYAAEGVLDGGNPYDAASRCALNASVAICVAAGAASPPRLVRIDLQSGRTTTIFDPNKALKDATLAEPEIMVWRDADGQRFTGVFFDAVGREPDHPAPLFITYYACRGYLRGGIGDEWPLATLAAAGIGVLCINKPAAADPATQWSDGFAARDYEIARSGVECVIAVLAERGAIDPLRVGMGGLSFGAEATMWIAMNSDVLSAISVASPVLTESYYWERALMGENFHSMLKRAWKLGAPGETSGGWRTFSPAYHLDKFRRLPLLMQVPEQEYLMATDYFVPLLASGAPTEVHVFPHEPHVKVQPRHQLAVYERNLDWFRFWLSDYVDPVPSKAAQYQRWREMRTRIWKFDDEG